MKMTLAALRHKGFGGETYTKVREASHNPALDSALVTMPNMGIPAELTTYFDADVVEILTAVRRARAVTGGKEVQKGDATTASAKFPVLEYTGNTEPYNDFAEGSSSSVNANWVTRDNYLFSTTRQYGDLEEARSALAKLNLASSTQKAAASIIDVDSNRFYFHGVAGLRNYGLLNDPGLNANITPAANGTANSPKWESKTTQQIYEDILDLFAELVEQTGGTVSEGDQLVLAMSPAMAVRLGKATTFNVSVLKMLNDYFGDLTIVKAPEYATASGELMQFIAPVLEGQENIFLAFSEKFYAFAPVRGVSSIKQKFRAGTYGAIIRRPAAIAGMIGM